MNCEEFSLRLSKDCAVAPGAHVLAAVSGGADSMALLCFLLQIRDSYPLTVSCVHVEHGIRGEASLEDLRFVRAFCQAHAVPFYPEYADTPAFVRDTGCGLEEAARALRHGLLQRTAERIGADVIALAHHIQDQAETLLLHALRGSDINGLCAMQYRSGNLIRPLLDREPEKLKAYLLSAGHTWREDETNSDVRYSRNRIRHRVMPELLQISAGAPFALCRLSRAAMRDEEYFAQVINELGLHATMLADGAAIERSKLSGLHRAVLGRVLVRAIEVAGIASQSAKTIGEIADALEREEGTVNLCGGAFAHIGKRFLCLTGGKMPQVNVPLSVPGETDTPLGRFIVRPAIPGETGDGRRSQAIPLHMLEGLRVTVRREGDTMIPFGQHRPVKLKKLMIDAAVERAMRTSMPVLRNAQGIVWAVGLRPGEMCRAGAEELQMIVEYCGFKRCVLSSKQTV